MEHQMRLKINTYFLLMDVLVQQFDCVPFGIFVVGFHTAVGIDAKLRSEAEREVAPKIAGVHKRKCQAE